MNPFQREFREAAFFNRSGCEGKKDMNTNTLLKNGFPFRLGCTSYVYPDDLLPNVRKMAPIVDDIEIVLFETESLSNLPGPDAIAALREISEQHGNTYTIHFPIDKKAGASDKKERHYFQDQALKIMQLAHPLHPFAYVLHLEGISESASPDELAAWQANSMETCEKIATSGGVDSNIIAVENLGYPVEWNVPIIEHFGFSFCMDIGHLWLYRKNWKNILERYLGKTRVMHLHGVSKGKDHLSLLKNDQEALRILVREYLPSFQNVLTLEVFSKEDTFDSIRRVKTLWQE